MSDKYVLDGKVPRLVTSLTEWADGIEKENRRVDYDEVGEYRISTVFLGLDHNFGSGPTPILFETMILDKSGQDCYMERTSTWDDALEAHHRAIVVADGLS